MSTGSARNQTLSFLRQRLSQVGLEPNTKHGQNFLIDLNIQRLLLESAQLEMDDMVLEIGTGTAALTLQMAERVTSVVTVEIDQHLAQLASEELIDHQNVTILRQDALRNKNNFAPEVLEAIERNMTADDRRRLKLVANLPYNVATPVMSNLLRCKYLPVSMTVMVQKEVADRICAVPSTKDYGALSVWMQAQCRAEIVRIVPPSAFWPRPKVHSAILHIEFQPERRAAIPDVEYFHEFTRMLFLHRRKVMRKALSGAYRGRLEKEQVDEVIQQMQLLPDVRAEQLDGPTIMELSERLRPLLQQGPQE